MKYMLIFVMLALALCSCDSSNSPSEYVNESDYYKISDVKMIYEVEDNSLIIPAVENRLLGEKLVVLFNKKAFLFEYYDGSQNNASLVKLRRTFNVSEIELNHIDSLSIKFSFRDFPSIVPVGADTNKSANSSEKCRLSWREKQSDKLVQTIYSEQWIGTYTPAGFDSVFVAFQSMFRSSYL